MQNLSAACGSDHRDIKQVTIQMMENESSIHLEEGEDIRANQNFPNDDANQSPRLGIEKDCSNIEVNYDSNQNS